MARNSRNLYSFTNTIKFRLDRESWQSVKKQSETWARQLARDADPQNAAFGNTNRRRRQPEQDAHIKHYRSLQREQAKFAAKQKQVIRRFISSNKELRSMSGVQKKILIDKLREAKTVESLLVLERKLKHEVTDKARKDRQRTRELQRQKGLTSGMAKDLSIAFGAAASANIVIGTGLTFESLERSMLVTSGSAEKAAENFKFVRSEAMKYGKDFATLTESYVSFQAAAGNKLSQKDMRDLFSGVATYSTALGMSTEKTQRAYVAISQMLGKSLPL